MPVLYRSWILAALDEKDEAFELLDAAYQARDPMLLFSRVTLLDSLRSDPRFAALYRRMGLELEGPS